MNASAAPEAAAKTVKPSLASLVGRKPSAAVKRLLPEGKRPIDVAAFSSSI